MATELERFATDDEKDEHIEKSPNLKRRMGVIYELDKVLKTQLHQMTIRLSDLTANRDTCKSDLIEMNLSRDKMSQEYRHLFKVKSASHGRSIRSISRTVPSTSPGI